jgi:glycosyltransferase involved in cell wall biosynthesis
MLSYDILIPVYNAEKTIYELLSRIHESASPKPLCIIVVDDGSQDKTSNILQSFDVFKIRLNENKGKGQALRVGFNAFLKKSTAEYLLCMDADLQHPVESIPNFIEQASRTRSSLIIGSRKLKIGVMPLHRILSNRITSFIMSLMSGQPILDSQCGFRLIHRELLNSVLADLQQSGFQMESEFILKTARGGYKIDFVSIPTIYHNESSSIRNFQDTIKFISFVLKNLMKQK